MVLAVAALAAFYGLSGPPSAPPHPLQSAIPGQYCTTPGDIGAAEGRLFMCTGPFPFVWTPLR
jgi:hypothetical protein